MSGSRRPKAEVKLGGAAFPRARPPVYLGDHSFPRLAAWAALAVTESPHSATALVRIASGCSLPTAPPHWLGILVLVVSGVCCSGWCALNSVPARIAFYVAGLFSWSLFAVSLSDPQNFRAAIEDLAGPPKPTGGRTSSAGAAWWSVGCRIARLSIRSWPCLRRSRRFGLLGEPVRSELPRRQHGDGERWQHGRDRRRMDLRCTMDGYIDPTERRRMGR